MGIGLELVVDVVSGGKLDITRAGLQICQRTLNKVHDDKNIAVSGLSGKKGE
ncbi:hypothetical protein [Oceanobacillus sojae]|uniref:hypothetical protein n=1 Tax=Oceanobacillus sojae TaxID=582851 RepID=UPI0021A6D41E|nr:hypothetical protein [Oceanobacillus sojae]MCT1904848.1 hypothetical protein [Oceanobacillus sojae]